MKNYKKIITGNGFTPNEIRPSIIDNKSLTLLFLSLSIFFIFFSSKIINENDFNQIYLIYVVLIILSIWFISERTYRSFRKTWIKKINKKEKEIHEKIEKSMKKKKLYEETFYIISKDRINSSQIRYFIYNIYNLSDYIDSLTIEEIIGLKDIEILSFYKKNKKEIKKKLKKLSVNNSIKLMEMRGIMTSFRKTKKELGF